MAETTKIYIFSSDETLEKKEKRFKAILFHFSMSDLNQKNLVETIKLQMGILD